MAPKLIAARSGGVTDDVADVVDTAATPIDEEVGDAVGGVAIDAAVIGGGSVGG